jgi:F-type H+-transporting ATPase subunit beta
MKPNRETPRKARLAHSGAVVSVCGSVVDVRFDRQLPAIYTVLRTGAENQIVIDGLSHLDAHRMRGIALTPTQGLARGMLVKDTGGPLQAPAGKNILSRMLNVKKSSLELARAPRSFHRLNQIKGAQDDHSTQ